MMLHFAVASVECIMPWPMFQQVARQAQHMSDMMDRLDVDAVAAARHQRGRTYAEARSNCLYCPFARECARWIHGAADARSPAEYCPNAAFFGAFQRGRETTPAATRQ